MKTYEEILASQATLAHFNPNHDKLGRFAKNMFGRSKSSKPVDKTKSKDYNKIDKDKLKKYAVIGAISVATALTVIGGVYLVKSGKLNRFINLGKRSIDDQLTKHGDLASSVSNGLPSSEQITPTKSVIKRLKAPETIKEALLHTNPNFYDEEYGGNCTLCATAAYLRTQGYDVKAGKVPGGEQLLKDHVQRAFNLDFTFDDSRIIETTAKGFSESPDRASKILVRKFGSNADGVIGYAKKTQHSLRYTIDDGSKVAGGHAFNFRIRNGIVQFFDTQNPSGVRDDAWCRSFIWNTIDPEKPYTAIRLDGTDINISAILKELE